MRCSRQQSHCASLADTGCIAAFQVLLWAPHAPTRPNARRVVSWNVLAADEYLVSDELHAPSLHTTCGHSCVALCRVCSLCLLLAACAPCCPVQVQVDIQDLVKQNPEWAPTAVPTLSSGFNAWMDTLPFGDNFHKHLQEKKDKQIWVEKERLENPHFLLRRVEANNAYLQSRVDFLDKLVQVTYMSVSLRRHAHIPKYTLGYPPLLKAHAQCTHSVMVTRARARTCMGACDEAGLPSGPGHTPWASRVGHRTAACVCASP